MPVWSPTWFGSAGGAGGYVISQSALFDGAGDNLSRTPSGAASSARIFTMSVWLKRAEITDTTYDGYLYCASPDEDGIALTQDDDKLAFRIEGSTYVMSAANEFTDPTAWFHLLLRIDSTQSSASNRIRIYINGSALTLTGTPPAQNYDYTRWLVASKIQRIGWNGNTQKYFSGYMAEFAMYDGTSLGPDSFGETSDGIWVPIEIPSSGFGNNGFHLTFSDASALGADTSGNSNNFTVNNLVAANQVEDSPTSDADDVGNYPIINPSLPVPSVAESQPSHVLSEGNLTATGTGAPGYVQSSVVTQGISSGKFYWEFTFVSGAIYSRIGIATVASISATAPNINVYVGNEATANTNWALNAWASGTEKGKIGHGTGSVTQGNYANSTTWAASDVVGVALDMDNGALWFHRNGTYLGADLAAGNAATISEVQAGTVTNAAVGPNSNCAHNVNLSSLGTVIPCFTTDGVAAVVSINFGQKAFSHTVPTGFKRLMSANMAALSVSSPATGSFTGNALAGGPFIYLGYTPDTSGTSTITESGGSASTITWGTHALAYASGFKIISSADDYNKAAVNAYSIAIDTDLQIANNNRAQTT